VENTKVKDRKIEQLNEFLAAHHGEVISIRELAYKFEFSRYQIAKACKGKVKSFKKSVHGYTQKYYRIL
jgi:hypothetical protein